jgi:hypothetical protein
MWIDSKYVDAAREPRATIQAHERIRKARRAAAIVHRLADRRCWLCGRHKAATPCPEAQ